MDKNRNRTDLLAAGRKKLQQFRQKKDNKGNSSKSSGKPSKSARDTSADAETEAMVGQQNVAEGEASRHVAEDTISSLETISRVDSLASDAIAASDKAGTLEMAAPAVTIEFQSEYSGVEEIRSNHCADGQDIDPGIAQKGESSSLDHESDPIILRKETVDSSTPAPALQERQQGEEQVTDVGAMQEVGSSCGNQIYKSEMTQLEGDGNLPNDFVVTVGNHMANESQNTEEVDAQDASLSKPDNASTAGVPFNAVEGNQEKHCPLTEQEESLDVSLETNNQLRENISSGLLNEDKPEMVIVSGHYSGDPTTCFQGSSGFIDANRPLEFKTDHIASLGCKQLDMSSGLNGSLIKLSQLADILQILDDDQFKFLLKKRGSSFEKSWGTNHAGVNDFVAHDAFEHLKEQLYITSFSKAVLCLQLSEHQKLIDEISIASGSFSEAQGKNEVLTEEIAVCKSELQEVLSVREELQKKLNLSREEAQSNLAKVHELQKKLEMTEHDRSIVSLELVDCQNSMKALQADEENLNESLEKMAEEKDKLLEENHNILVENEKLRRELAQFKASLESVQKEFLDLTENLALVREDRRRLEEEKDHIVHENCKLLADLSDYDTEIEVLKGENKNLNEMFASVLEGRQKLKVEKETMVHHTEAQSKQLSDCRGLVATLQMEISNLNNALKSMTEERNKFEEENNFILSESEKQLLELVEIRVIETGLRAEYSKTVDELSEATFRLNQLVEENENYKTILNFHRSDVKESEQRSNLFQSEEVENMHAAMEIQKSKSKHAVEQLDGDVYDDSSRFVGLKKHLEDAGILIQQLEKAIEDMHSTTFSGSNDSVVSSGVSRLIQAFESKGHSEDHSAEDIPFGNQTADNSYMISKKATENLRALLKDILWEAENASEFCKGVGQKKFLANTAETELRNDYDSLREYADRLEEANMELMVLFEAVRENMCYAVGKEAELRILYDALLKQELVLQTENNKLSDKVNAFQVKIGEFQNQLDETNQDSEKMIASISNQVQNLEAEVVQRELVLEEQWNSVVAQVLQIVGGLDVIVNTFHHNSSSGPNGNLDIVSYVAESVDSATKFIEALHARIEAADRDCLEISNAYNEIFERSGNLQTKIEMSSNTLHVLYDYLGKVIHESLGSHANESEKGDEVLDLSNPDFFDILLEQLKVLLDERLQHESTIKQLNSELMGRAKEIDDLEKNSLKPETILKLIEDIEQYVGLREREIFSDEPASRLEAMVYLLVQKYKEAEQCRNPSVSLERQLSDLQEQVEHLNFVLLQYENENLVFKYSLKSAEDDLTSINSKLQEKVAELEQSEHRVLSLREKLSIAVTKGKGLISQRDTLKQSLADTSRELEKCSQELLSKDARLHELETKLEAYAESGERMEALKSELSYIRNSATALRESFLLKDSTLQRIEEILEDLEVSEYFHSRDIIEKIELLAKSVSAKSLPQDDWDQRNSVEGGSYSDAGFVGEDRLKEDLRPDPYSGDDFRRRYEELQSKFYGLAEQNEMLEQSLMERNDLVQRCEEVLERVDIPSKMRSSEPEAKIQWMGSALLEAQDQCITLQEKIDYLERICGSLTTDIEDSRRRISELDVAFQEACREREILRHDNDETSKNIADLKNRNEHLQNELSMLQEQMLQMEDDARHADGAIRRLQQIVKDALDDSREDEEELNPGGVDFLEENLKSFIEKYKMLSSENTINIGPIDMHVSEKGKLPHITRDCEEQDVSILSKKLEDSIDELRCLKEEKNGYILNNQSLTSEVEALGNKKLELQELLNQEEQKSASLREKLNVAVRKGKSLLQQWDSMKQVIEDLNAEVERLKSEAKHNEKVISKHANQMEEFSATQQTLQIMESENAFLRDRLSEAESCLQEKEESWKSFVNALDDMDIGLPLSALTPIERLKQIRKVLHDLSSGLDYAEQESRKSKRAAELLLAELNEVQERNDGLQEELARASQELSELSREKDLAETAKFEALGRLEKLSHTHSEEQNRQISEFMLLKTGVDQMRGDLVATERELADVLAKDLEFLRNMESVMKSFLDLSSPHLNAPFSGGFPGCLLPGKSENKVFAAELSSLRERVYNHSHSLHEEACRLSDILNYVHSEYTSQQVSYESVKRDAKQLELIMKERESELCVLRGNVSLLFEACTSAILEIENWKSSGVGNASEKIAKPQISIGERNNFTNDTSIFTEDSARDIHNKLLFTVKDFMRTQSELTEDGQKEMKITLVNLQNELHEKDIQRDRICKELVSQIKQAEANAENCLGELKQVKAQLHDLQKHMVVTNEERGLLEKRIKELQDQETNSEILQEKVNSLSDAIAAKEQETEALMQALDEEEAQMEELANKNRTLEDELQKKNQDLETLETSRAKALKKLSVTVSKFDELHYLSESLLSEVEKLQSQLQERDGEISFLRQEVTRCTNDALAATQMSKRRSSDEIHDFLTWLNSLISRVRVTDETPDNTKGHHVADCKEMLQKQIMELISELENLRAVAQSSDRLLQEERSKVEELAHKGRFLEDSLRERESHIVMLQCAGDSAKATTSEVMEVEQLTNKWTSTGTIAPQVRSLRKTNNDQVAIAIDVDQNSGRLEEEDDDKAHGFKSLTTSKIVPRFTRPVSDMIDGLWVSCDRALMRQPALRLGVILYWAVLHALLGAFVV